MNHIQRFSILHNIYQSYFVRRGNRCCSYIESDKTEMTASITIALLRTHQNKEDNKNIFFRKNLLQQTLWSAPNSWEHSGQLLQGRLWWVVSFELQFCWSRSSFLSSPGPLWPRIERLNLVSGSHLYPQCSAIFYQLRFPVNLKLSGRVKCGKIWQKVENLKWLSNFSYWKVYRTFWKKSSPL